MRFLDRNRSDEAYDHFYQLVVDKSSGLTNPPCLSRARRPPKRYDSGTAPHVYTTPKDYFRHIYFEVLDVVRNEISRRFNQEALEYPKYIEIILLKAANLQSNEDIHVEE